MSQNQAVTSPVLTATGTWPALAQNTVPREKISRLLIGSAAFNEGFMINSGWSLIGFSTNDLITFSVAIL